MFRKLLATTAVAALLAGAAVAQDATTPAPAEPAPAPAEQTPPATTEPDAAATPAASGEGHLASNIIGEAVYNSSAEDAETIGNVTDLVVDADGSIKSLIVGVGGFLGVGQKNVEIDYKTAEWTERNGDRWIVVSSTKEQMESQPAFDPAPFEPAPPPAAAPDASTTAPAPAEPTTPPAGGTQQPAN